MAPQGPMNLFGLSVLCMWIACVTAQKGVQLRGKLGPANNAFGVVSVNTANDTAVPGNFQYQFWISVGGVKDILQVVLLRGASGEVVLDFDGSGQLQLNKTLNVGVTAIGGASKPAALAAEVEASPGSFYVAIKTAAGYVLQGPLGTTAVEPFTLTSSFGASGNGSLVVSFTGNAAADIKYVIPSTVTGDAVIYKGPEGAGAKFADLNTTAPTGTVPGVNGCLVAEIIGNPTAFYMTKGAVTGKLVPTYQIAAAAPPAAPTTPLSQPPPTAFGPSAAPTESPPSTTNSVNPPPATTRGTPPAPPPSAGAAPISTRLPAAASCFLATSSLALAFIAPFLM